MLEIAQAGMWRVVPLCSYAFLVDKLSQTKRQFDPKKTFDSHGTGVKVNYPPPSLTHVNAQGH